jgi:hypothetical protein
MTIKHLIISGGGPSIFQSFGIIQTLLKKRHSTNNFIGPLGVGNILQEIIEMY